MGLKGCYTAARLHMQSPKAALQLLPPHMIHQTPPGKLLQSSHFPGQLLVGSRLLHQDPLINLCTRARSCIR